MFWWGFAAGAAAALAFAGILALLGFGWFAREMMKAS